MRTTICLLLLITCSHLIFAHPKTYQLNLQRLTFAEKNDKLTESLKIIDNEIKNEEKSHLIINQDTTKALPIFAILKTGSKLLKESFFQSEVLTYLPKEAKLEILDIDKDLLYFKVKYENKEGYIPIFDVRGTSEVLNYINSTKVMREEAFAKEKIILDEEKRKEDLKQKVIKNNQQKADLAKHKADLAMRKQKLIDKYGVSIATKLLNGDIWLNMTSEMASESRGYPTKNNRSVGAWGVHEQWVYSNYILYFENGILTSWQD